MKNVHNIVQNEMKHKYMKCKWDNYYTNETITKTYYCKLRLGRNNLCDLLNVAQPKKNNFIYHSHKHTHKHSHTSHIHFIRQFS